MRLLYERSGVDWTGPEVLMEMLECVAFMLIRDGAMLVERRKQSKAVAPGAVAIPGGHLDGVESVDEAIRRELLEELDLEADDFLFVCTLLHRSSEVRRLHYYAVHSWRGELANNEAEELLWIPLDRPSELDLDVDRIALSEYLRVYGRDLS